MIKKLVLATLSFSRSHRARHARHVSKAVNMVVLVSTVSRPIVGGSISILCLVGVLDALRRIILNLSVVP